MQGMRRRFRELLNLPEMTPEQEMELLGNIASVPFQGGELAVQRLGELAGIQNATGEDLIRAAGDKLGADRLMKQETLDTIARGGGGVLEAALDPLNLASLGSAGLVKGAAKMGIREAARKQGQQPEAKTVKGFSERVKPDTSQKGIKLFEGIREIIPTTDGGIAPASVPRSQDKKVQLARELSKQQENLKQQQGMKAAEQKQNIMKQLQETAEEQKRRELLKDDLSAVLPLAKRNWTKPI